MTEEISYYDEDLTELIGEIERGIEGLRKLSPQAKTERVTELQGRMQRARQVLQAFKVEMRELPRDLSVTYDAKAKAHHATLQKLHGDLQWAKTEGSADGGGTRDVNDMNAGEIIQEGAKIQDKSKAAVDRMKRQIEESKQVGADTAQKLKGQTEQLKNIDQDIMKVKSNLARADLLLRAFMRRMATDKIVMVFMRRGGCLIFIGIIGIIAAKAAGVGGTEDLNAPLPSELNDVGSDLRRRLRAQLLFRKPPGVSPLGPVPVPQKRTIEESGDTQFELEMEDCELPPPAKPLQVAAAPSPALQPSGDQNSVPMETLTPSVGPVSSRRSGGSASGRATPREPSRAEKKPRRSASGSSTPLSTSPSTSLVVAPPVEADLQAHAVTRSEDFKSGRRIFHVHFGHGYVASLETRDEPDAHASQAEQVLSSRTQDINVVWDSPRYPQTMKLRAFYAVPKMVVIPSATCLGKRKVQAQVDKTLTPPLRALLVSQMLGAGAVREACSLVQRWQLQSTFEPAQLLQRMLQQKQYSAVFRFAREFGLTHQYPTRALLQRMLEERRYEGALKFVSARCTSVDGQHSPVDVIAMLVGSGHADVALKYVHKFKATARFPPEQLVSRLLQSEGTLSVRTWALLLKYVSLFNLEAAYPTTELLERVRRAGITAHRLNGKGFVLKGAKRASAAGAGASPASSMPASPALQPVRVGSAPN